MRHVTITAEVEKRCPYKDEQDTGTAVLRFDVLKDAPELHELADHLATWADIALSHEEFTAMLRDRWWSEGCRSVTTTWQTAGMTVEVTV